MNYYINWYDNVLLNPYKYVDEALKNPFQNVLDGDSIFKNIQPRDHDEAAAFLLSIYPDYDVTYNFIRQSSYKQKEPNYIHSDEMMGDKTAILYLNKIYPKEAGTTLYENNKPMCTIYASFNRMIVFDSTLPHSRNMFDNFGEDIHSRLVQVIFVKKDETRGTKEKNN